MKKIFVAVFFSLLFSLISYAQAPVLKKELEEASKAFLAKDYEKSYELFKLLAEKGEPISQYFMGLHYLNGFHVAKDLDLAFDWVDRSAELGYPAALTQKAKMLITAQGVEKDLPAAFTALLNASDAGDRDAMSLACILFYQMTEPGEASYHLCLLSKTYPFNLNSRMQQVEDIIRKIKPQLNTEEIKSAEAKVKAWKILEWVYPSQLKPLSK